MTTQYDPSELDNFLDELEQGKHDRGAEEAPGAAEPQPGESQSEDDFDVDEFTVGGQSAAQPAAPATQATAPAQPVGNADNVDPFELQRKLAIEQGKNEAYASIFQGINNPKPAEQKPAEAPKDYIFDPTETELSDEEKEMFERSSPLVAKVAKQIANQMYKQAVRPLEDKLAQAQQHVEQTEQQVRQQRLREFHVRLHQEIPDLATTSATPEFNAYLKQAAPRSGGQWTVEAELTAALQNGNIAAVKEIVSGFKPTQQPGVQNVAPGRPQSGTPPTSDKGSKMLAYSKLIKAENDYNAGLITLDKYSRILEAYRDAEMNNNVDYES